MFIWSGANMGLFLRWGNWAVAKPGGSKTVGGVGSVKAMTYVQTIAPKDGTVFGMRLETY